MLQYTHEHFGLQENWTGGGRTSSLKLDHRSKSGGDKSLSLPGLTRQSRSKLILISIFLLCLTTGLLSGLIFKNNQKSTQAASSNITVTDNNQVITIDQGTTRIEKQSTVIVHDPEANYGYSLSARIATNDLPSGSTIKLWSSKTGSLCTTEASACILPTTLSNPSDPTSNTATTNLLSTTTNQATLNNGDSTIWEVLITIPTTTPQANYILDIEYSEEAIRAMQTITNNSCSAEHTVVYDARDGQHYFIRKIPGSGANGEDLCWMESNLRYSGSLAERTAGQSNVAQPEYMNPGGSATLSVTDPLANTNFYGYLYNWCAAMGGQANACQDTIVAQPAATPNICPAGWRLPSGGAEAPSSDYSSMASVVGATVSPGTMGSNNFRTNFLAVYSGLYSSSLEQQGSYGRYWSSSVVSGVPQSAYYLSFGAAGVNPGNDQFLKLYGFAVRCVL